MATPEVRIVAVRTRTIFLVLGIAVLVGLGLVLVLLAWHVLTWIVIAMLLAAALNPAVERLEARGLGRGWAATVVFFARCWSCPRSALSSFRRSSRR